MAAVAEICADIKVVSGVAQTLIVSISVSIWAASQALINVRTGTGPAGAMARRAGLGGSVEVIWAGAGAGTVNRVAVAAEAVRCERTRALTARRMTRIAPSRI